MQRFVVPPIGAGCGLTRNGVVIKQPLEATVKVMLVIPATIPVTTPVPKPTVATDGALLLHEPPPAGFVSVDVSPTQVLVVPAIAGGNALTVTGAIAVHPVGAV